MARLKEKNAFGIVWAYTWLSISFNKILHETLQVIIFENLRVKKSLCKAEMPDLAPDENGKDISRVSRRQL